MLELIDGRDQTTPVHIPRPRAAGQVEIESRVAEIVERVRGEGDAALIELTERLDDVRLEAGGIRVPDEQIANARDLVRPQLIHALEVLGERLRATCERQLPAEWREQVGGASVGELVRPLRRVGVYVPGGRASYPSSVLMAAVPARIAGVGAVAVVTPPGPTGEVSEAVLAACSVAGIDEVYRVGGAQAIAALAYGTESVRPVEKIVGPGNAYVTLAKRHVRGWVGIDTDAGPTEIAIVADLSADPRVLAIDLIAQAEHGPLGTHVLITWEPDLAQAVITALELEVLRHPRSDDVENALIEGGRAVLVRDLPHAIETVNAFASEHLQLVYEGAESDLGSIQNAGSVFVGPYSPVPLGDYVGGTNHVLPTGGAARWSSGLTARDFVKTIYVSEFDRAALERLAPHVRALAAAEGLTEHARAVDARLGVDELGV